MDTKFSVAVHMLILISESTHPINSEQIAESVGTNSSYIRKIFALLKKSGIVDGHRGISGYSLMVSPNNLSLLQIYLAVMEEENVHLLDIHQNSNDDCIVGRYIKPVLIDTFKDLEANFAILLKRKTLASCIDDIKNKMKE